MKISNFKNIFSKLSFRNRLEYKTIGEKSSHDWKLILLSFIFLVVIVLGGSLYMFIGVSKGDIFLVEQKTESIVQIIGKNELANTIKFFDARKTRLETLESSRPAVGDPSL